MFKNALIVGVSQVKHWSNSDTVADVLGRLGANTGNMVFTEALSRALYEPTKTNFSIPDEALAGRDAIVLASANWINEFEDYAWLANRLEQTQLPVFLIGVGAQAGLDHKTPNVPQGTQRLLKIVSERSGVIAARGEFTCDTLEKYGITNAEPVGCPSMLMADRSGIMFHREPSLDGVVLHGTRHGFGRANPFQDWIYQEAMRNNWDLLLQSENADIYYALGKTNNAKIMAEASNAVMMNYGTPDVDAIGSYLKQHGKVFFDFGSWTEFMKTRNFCVGTRIHGTVASIVAGTPALLIAHDSRTLELAEAMSIPHVLSSELDNKQPFPIETLMERYHSAKSLPGYQKYFDRYIALFSKNKLALDPVFVGSNS
ncbi:polysaccharide pyruvyl transferase family protein [Paracoccus sp. (in: a-proteobacteria)]|uniref:polysaccharide pyruvyl transferase family protein n=1 Tax=Paracoccus sp. TaxID=267 RepID=UPI002AFE92A6|nr:polysaccharide pyruvyl transferase family protein [Paracoccus sp. (in: a-proteobacteria)]